jgi:hypothetical protein
MTLPRAALALVLIVMLLPTPRDAWGQLPEPRVREQPAPLDAAVRHFDAGRWEEAIEAFEAAVREGAVLLPAGALKSWGVAASEAGRPLAAYVRLRQYLAREPQAADREALQERVGRAREALAAGAARFSRVLATAERRPDEESGGERHVVRVAARDGEVSVEGLSGLRVEAPLWRRAEEIPLAPYLDLVRRLLDAPAVIDDVPAQPFDPNAAGPRRAVVLRLVIGDEERRLEALHGEPYDRLKGAMDVVLEFARRVPALPDPEPKESPTPGRKRR